MKFRIIVNKDGYYEVEMKRISKKYIFFGPEEEYWGTPSSLVRASGSYEFHSVEAAEEIIKSIAAVENRREYGKNNVGVVVKELEL